MQIVTDSTVFEVGALSGGGDVPADVATQSWVNAQISNFITEDDLAGYATQDDISAKADVSSLTAYAEVTSLTAYATKDDISGFITEIPANLSAETLQVKNNVYTVISAGTGSESDSGTLLVNGTAAAFRVGPAQTTGSVRINSNGTTPSIEGGKGSGPEAAYSLSCDSSGHGILALNTTTLNASELQSMKSLSATVNSALNSIANINDVQIPNIYTSLASCVQHQAAGEAPEIFNI